MPLRTNEKSRNRLSIADGDEWLADNKDKLREIAPTPAEYGRYALTDHSKKGKPMLKTKVVSAATYESNKANFIARLDALEYVPLEDMAHHQTQTVTRMIRELRADGHRICTIRGNDAKVCGWISHAALDRLQKLGGKNPPTSSNVGGDSTSPDERP